MGYTTNFSGRFLLDPPLTESKAETLTAFSGGRHEGSSYPSYWCQWVPSKDNAGIEWDGNEKFYEYVDWLNYLIREFLTPWGISIRGKVAYSGEEVTDAGYLEIQNGQCVQVELMRRDDETITR